MMRFCSFAPSGAAMSALVMLLLGVGLQSCERAHAQEPQLQVGLWYAAPFNIEEYYLNLFYLGANKWQTKDGQGDALLTEGYVSPEGYPQKWPGSRMRIGGFFQGGSDEARRQWNGDWLLKWAPAKCAEMQVSYADGTVSASRGRIAFTRDFDKNPHLAFQVFITSLDCPLTELALIRAENEDAYEAGEIWNPRLKPFLADYDMLRMMDPMSGGTTTITHPDQLAGMDSLFWGAAGWPSHGTLKPSHQSMPLDAVIRAGIAYDKALWLNAPLMLGAPQSYWDMRPESGEWKEWNNAFFAMVQENAEAILNSPAWDDYADALIAAMASEGYPQDRPLYISPGNEVWNWTRQYWLGSHYAHEIAKGLPQTGNNLRHGYGALVARLKKAIDAAQARAGTDFDITVIFEGQTGSTPTKLALDGAKAWLESEGENWGDYAPGFGTAPASYWGGTWFEFALTDQEYKGYWKRPKKEKDALKATAQARWEEMIATDPEGTAKDFADFILTDPDTTLGLQFTLRNFQSLSNISKTYGVRAVGFYEGGSHFNKPGWMDQEWYETFLWGPEGGRVNYEFNVAIAKRFPGIMLSNYIFAGPVGNSPFPEGSPGADNPYALSWRRVMETLREQ